MRRRKGPIMTDYSTMLDPEIREFIRQSEAHYPADATRVTLKENRALYDVMCAHFRAPRPPGITVTDTPIAGVPCRQYDPAKGGPVTVIYIHGGGFVLGGLDSHDDICGELAARTGLVVISVDYRLAPDHLHPAQFDDAFAVAETVGKTSAIVLVGDSAGGQLAASVAHSMRGSGVQINGQVLIYPGLGGPRGTGSHVTHARAPMLSAQEVDAYAGIRFENGVVPDSDSRAAPLTDTDFSGLPHTLAIAAQCDPLADDVVRYADKIRAAGGSVTAITEPGLVHGYLRARHISRRAGDSFDRICRGVAEMAAT